MVWFVAWSWCSVHVAGMWCDCAPNPALAPPLSAVEQIFGFASPSNQLLRHHVTFWRLVWQSWIRLVGQNHVQVGRLDGQVWSKRDLDWFATWQICWRFDSSLIDNVLVWRQFPEIRNFGVIEMHHASERRYPGSSTAFMIFLHFTYTSIIQPAVQAICRFVRKSTKRPYTWWWLQKYDILRRLHLLNSTQCVVCTHICQRRPCESFCGQLVRPRTLRSRSSL